MSEKQRQLRGRLAEDAAAMFLGLICEVQLHESRGSALASSLLVIDRRSRTIANVGKLLSAHSFLPSSASCVFSPLAFRIASRV